MNNTNNSTVIMKVVCAILFIIFTFFYLYDYKADVLAMVQHVLSEGHTTYNGFVGAVLITLFLQVVQLGINSFLRLNGMAHSFTYFPSLLILALITDVSPTIDEGVHIGVWLWLFPLLIVFFGVVVSFCKQVEPFEQKNYKLSAFFSKNMWVNVGVLTIMFLFVGLVSGHSDVFHYRMKMEGLMCEEKYEEALEVGRKSLQTDSSLTCLRIICLEKTHQLGKKLFTYPLIGGSKAMVPDGKSVKVMMWKEPHVKIYFKDGKRFYPHTLEHRLMSYLLDKDLDGFVRTLQKKNIKDYNKLHRHIREALTLYTHKRANANIVYHNSVMDADFADYQSLERKFVDSIKRRNAVRDVYKNTYWYYYQYE